MNRRSFLMALPMLALIPKISKAPSVISLGDWPSWEMTYNGEAWDQYWWYRPTVSAPMSKVIETYEFEPRSDEAT